jgi:hypothetical protein
MTSRRALEVIRNIKKKLEERSSVVASPYSKMSTDVPALVPQLGTLTTAWRLVQGREIIHAYNDARVPSSLVGHESIQWFAENPNVFLLQAVRVDNEGIVRQRVGRALVWRCTDGTMVMDEVYVAPNSGIFTHNFDREARERKFVSVKQIGSGEQRQKYQVEMNVPTRSEDRWPYLDTFQFLQFTSRNTAILSTVPDDQTSLQLDRHSGHASFYPPTTEEDFLAIEQLAFAVETWRLSLMHAGQLIIRYRQSPDLRSDIIDEAIDRRFPLGDDESDIGDGADIQNLNIQSED